MRGQRSPRSAIVRCLLVTLLLATIWLAAVPSAGAQDAPASPAPVEFPPTQPLPDATPRAGGPLKVVATTPILADLTRQVGGARVDVTSILPPNADPHEFEPKPEDLVTVEGASLIVEHGLHLDAWASDIIKNAGSSAPT